MPDTDRATIAPLQPTGQRPMQYRGLQPIDTDELLLATLEPNEQAVLRASGSYVDRAKALNLPIGTLRSRLHRARAKLVALREMKQSEPNRKPYLHIASISRLLK
jgi:DNA-directed RNA polymerase specialized sigma24 family protein